MNNNGYNNYNYGGNQQPQDPWGPQPDPWGPVPPQPPQGGQNRPRRGGYGHKKTLIILIAVAACVLLILSTITVLLLTGVIGSGGHVSVSTGAGEFADVEGLEKPDNPTETDDYYWDNSEKVIAVTPASESVDVPSESEVVQALHDRGFTEEAVTYAYTMDGEYCGDTEAAEDSDNRSPMYFTTYVSKNDELWTVYVINGQTIAYPVSYNLDSGLNYEVLISESAAVTSYNSDTNQFYETLPKGDVIQVLVVDEISSKTLDQLTNKEIGREN